MAACVFFKNRPLVEMAGRGVKKSHVRFFSKLNAAEKRAVQSLKTRGRRRGNGEALFCQISSLFEKDGDKWRKLQTPPPTPPLEGRGEPCGTSTANKADHLPSPSRGGVGGGVCISLIAEKEMGWGGVCIQNKRTRTTWFNPMNQIHFHEQKHRETKTQRSRG